uniref:Limbin-like n=1 Tax=Saccoglossus kowalevskii TaxID=10224 RepID=A0ABM0MD14_SACKO|nr:PREDICTED: limbin-like [Saccoglossus kowalevskii]
MFLSFKAFFDSNSLMLNTGLASVYTVTVTSESLPADLVTLENPGRQYTVSDTACVNKVEEQETSYLYNTGAGALAFFICLIIALVLVALFFLIWIKVLKKTPPFSVVEPDMKASKHGQGRGLIMNAKDAMKTGFNAIKEYSIIAIDESIVYILTLKDKLSIYRELDNLDVLATITVDIELEIQRIDMMIESVLYLVQSLRMNKDITKQVEDKCISKFQRNIKDLNKKLNDEYRLESATLIKRLSSQNKGKLYQLHKKHEVEKEEAKDKTKGMTDDERKDLMDLIDKQHQAEENELTHLLKLEQDEEQEKLRKEFAIRKRMAVKAIQHQLLDDVKTEGNLTEEQADWLMKQHKKNMNTLEKFMDDEISRQRMLLDEKLARRRALAESKEDQEDYHRDVLNTMATQQMGMVQTLAKNERLTEAQAEEMLARIQKDLLALKKKFDNEQTRQDEALHKRLSELKKRRIEQKEREHKQELADLEKKQKIKSQNGNVDPQGYIEAKEHLLSQQRGELNDLENQLDEDAAKELEQVRAQHVKKVQHDIKNSSDKLCKELGNKAGLDEEMKNEIMAQHERDLEKLLETREEERSKHERILKKRLAKNRKEWAKRKEVEKEEQQKIREHEEQMVGRLMATQVVMSNADRDKILQEHEKQLVKLENSLTLNKLRQKRKLEEKMSAKKAKQLEKLEKRQHQESQLGVPRFSAARRAHENTWYSGARLSNVERLMM